MMVICGVYSFLLLFFLLFYRSVYATREQARQRKRDISELANLFILF